MGEETLKSLVELGLAKTPADLFNITEDQFKRIERQGSKGFKKFRDGLLAKSEISVALFFASLDLEGTRSWEAIVRVKNLQSITEVKAAALAGNYALFAKAERISSERAKLLCHEIVNRMDEIIALEKHIKIKVAGSKLLGKTIVITGALSAPRSQIEALVKDAGGSVASDVSARTTHLVTNEASGSSKYRKAQARGIPTITEKQLMEMLL